MCSSSYCNDLALCECSRGCQGSGKLVRWVSSRVIVNSRNRSMHVWMLQTASPRPIWHQPCLSKAALASRFCVELPIDERSRGVRALAELSFVHDAGVVVQLGPSQWPASAFCSLRSTSCMLHVYAGGGGGGAGRTENPHCPVARRTSLRRLLSCLSCSLRAACCNPGFHVYHAPIPHQGWVTSHMGRTDS